MSTNYYGSESAFPWAQEDEDEGSFSGYEGEQDNEENLESELAMELLDDIVTGLDQDFLEDGIVRVFAGGAHAQPTSVKNTAKNASRTMTMKIACTTALVVRVPTCSEFPSTCIP